MAKPDPRLLCSGPVGHDAGIVEVPDHDRYSALVRVDIRDACRPFAVGPACVERPVGQTLISMYLPPRALPPVRRKAAVFPGLRAAFGPLRSFPLSARARSALRAAALAPVAHGSAWRSPVPAFLGTSRRLVPLSDICPISGGSSCTFDVFLAYRIPPDVVLSSYIRGDGVYCPFLPDRSTTWRGDFLILWLS